MVSGGAGCARGGSDDCHIIDPRDRSVDCVFSLPSVIFFAVYLQAVLPLRESGTAAYKWYYRSGRVVLPLTSGTTARGERYYRLVERYYRSGGSGTTARGERYYRLQAALPLFLLFSVISLHFQQTNMTYI